MLLRFAVFGMMALGLAGFGVVSLLAFRQPPVAPAPMANAPAPAPPPPTRYVVLAAAAPMRAGLLIKPDELVAKEVTERPVGAQEDTPATRAGLNGAMLRRNLAAGEPVLAADVMRPGDRGFLAAVLAPNYRAASVAVDAVSGSAGLIWPGDHVDLILTQALDDSALPAGRRVAAETVLSDVRVIAIDQQLAHGVPPTAEQAGLGHTVTLEVLPADVERIAVATKLGRLTLSVRAAEESGPASLAASAKTTWGADVSPALGDLSPQKTGGTVLRLYQGSADAKEIKF